VLLSFILTVVFSSLYVRDRIARYDHYYFEAVLQSSTEGTAQLFFDKGRGIQESDSIRIPVSKDDAPQLLRFRLAPGTWRGLGLVPHDYQRLWLSPIDREASLTVRTVRIVDPAGNVVKSFNTSDISAIQQIDTIKADGDKTVIKTIPGANHPIIAIRLDGPLRLPPTIWMTIRLTQEAVIWHVASLMLVCFLLVMTLYTVLDRRPVVMLMLNLFERKSAKICALCAIPLFIALFSIFGPFLTDTVYLYSGVAFDVGSRVLHGPPTIDPNFGTTSFALGSRAASDVLSGHLPLWNHYEGLGSPLLGEMQSAALFPFTWLLALPHGQAVEQALLQLLAGIGAFLFFRKFGLGATAALAGSMLFEINGVFAWLRNAIFNPVAFLPWLFFAVESFRASALASRTLPLRMPMICVGAGMAALALYAGFPEEVYLYALLLIAWVVFRMAGLSGRQNVTFLTDLLLTGLVALALSAPVLVAFVDFLGDAEVGAHYGNGFYGHTMNPWVIIQYIMPYIYGPIFTVPNPTINGIWGSTGGYIGFAPVVIAFAGLFIPNRRAVKIFLVGWVVIALGVTHGLPGIYPAFMALPLTKVAACPRYLNLSWIFCIIFLGALFIDRIPTLPQPMLRRILGWAVASGLISIAAAAVGALPVISQLGGYQAFVAGALLCVAVLSYGILRAARSATARGAAAALSGILVAEAVMSFLFPYISYPRQGKLDDDVISFLQANIGCQRVVNTTEAWLNPNYGSYFGIPLLNYDDIPVPKRTAHYIKENLDPYANANIFLPWFPMNLSPGQQADRQKIFRERLPCYAQAGVKYLLAGADFNSNPAFHLLSNGSYPYRLASGQRAEISAQEKPDILSTVTAISMLVGTYNNTSSGHLKVTLCAGTSTCSEGLADIRQAEDNRPLLITLDRPVTIEAGKGYTIRIEKLDGDKDVALWMYPLASTDTATKILGTPVAVRDNYLPDLRFIPGSDLKPVLRSRSMTIYALPGTRDYFSADSCELKPVSHDRVDASCPGPSKLLRLELYMRGWSATVNGQTMPVGLSEDGTFQSIDLPAGASRIEFQYEPHGFKWALGAACAALLLVLAVFAKAIFDAARRARHSPEQPG
jgi:hypothetical protein